MVRQFTGSRQALKNHRAIPVHQPYGVSTATMADLAPLAATHAAATGNGVPGSDHVTMINLRSMMNYSNLYTTYASMNFINTHVPSHMHTLIIHKHNGTLSL